MGRWRLTVTLPRRRKPEVDLTFPSFERAIAAAERIQAAMEGMEGTISLEEL